METLNKIKGWITFTIAFLVLLGYFLKLNQGISKLNLQVAHLEKENDRTEKAIDGIFEYADETSRDVAEIKTNIEWIKKYMEE